MPNQQQPKQTNNNQPNQQPNPKPNPNGQMPPQGQMPPMMFGGMPPGMQGSAQGNLMALLGRRTAWWIKLLISAGIGFGILFILSGVFVRDFGANALNDRSELMQNLFAFFENLGWTTITIEKYWQAFFVAALAFGIQFGFMALFILKTKGVFADSCTWVFAWTGLWMAAYCFGDATLWLVVPLGLVASLGLVILSQIIFAIMIYKNQMRKLGINPDQVKAMFAEEVRRMQGRGQGGQPMMGPNGQPMPQMSKKELDEALKAQGIDIDALDMEFGSEFGPEDDKPDTSIQKNADIKVTVKTKPVDNSTDIDWTKTPPATKTTSTKKETSSKPKTTTKK